MKLRSRLIVLICFVGLTGRLLACDCAFDINSVAVSFGYADLVIMGKVLSSKVVEKKRDTISQVDQYGDTLYTVKIDPNAYRAYTILVEDRFKGEVNGDTVEVKVEMYSSCTTSLEEGSDLFIFANIDDNSYFTHYCSGNMKANHKDQKILRKLAAKLN